VIVTAPTRTGKITDVAIPILLTYGHSIVAMDLKGELYQLTSGWRAKQGQKIRVFAPYDEAGRTHRFNPASHNRRIYAVSPWSRKQILCTRNCVNTHTQKGRESIQAHITLNRTLGGAPRQATRLRAHSLTDPVSPDT
jgi:hypothetical protein